MKYLDSKKQKEYQSFAKDAKESISSQFQTNMRLCKEYREMIENDGVEWPIPETSVLLGKQKKKDNIIVSKFLKDQHNLEIGAPGPQKKKNLGVTLEERKKYMNDTFSKFTSTNRMDKINENPPEFITDVQGDITAGDIDGRIVAQAREQFDF